MRVAKSMGGRKATAAIVAAAATVGLIGSSIGSGDASAAGVIAKDRYVTSCGMPTGNALGKGNPKGRVKVQTWMRPGNKRTVILLDGLRAEYGTSGWFQQTNAWRLVNQGVNVVMPVGGPASFYTDWDAPSNFNGQRARYRWGCVIDKGVVPMLRRAGFGSKNGKYALAGVSAGGNAALTHAAQRRDLYYAAASFSGYNYLSAPGMRTALRVAMLDVAPGPWNVDAMWGPPWSPRWTQNDPAMLINRMHGLKVFVGSGNGFFGKYNYPQNVGDDLFKGTPLEMLAWTQAKAFEVSAQVQGLPVMTYDANGTHAWGYWRDMLFNAKRRGLFN
ncbi:MAG: alpha/beta hydrolase-fold protein [Gordonia sp. (in: high G+C Gram-positive bacteria)]|uniref:alpha/beta hydrolase n=1 Tax=Gordonia sp. (in: high G+C Gram-positive bacteria) TaxID=84139 RepID=UPI0039E60AA6